MVNHLLWWLMVLLLVVLVIAGILYLGNQAPGDCAAQGGVMPENCVERSDGG
jgi:hypothetical protein